MRYRLGLAQCGFPTDGDTAGQVGRLTRDAAASGCDLVVFPENLMCPGELTDAELRQIAEPLDGPFVRACRAAAADAGIWAVVTFAERAPGEQPPYNTALVLDDAGEVRGTYRKCHLYDAHGVFESRRMSRGDALGPVVAAPFATIGVAICYDLRFPEVCRALALAGADLVAIPAAWHAGPAKELHWTRLVEARAIENELVVAGVCRADERYVGRSLAVGPTGESLCTGPAASGQRAEALLYCDVDTEAITRAREAMPVLAHRRPKLYGALADSHQ